MPIFSFFREMNAIINFIVAATRILQHNLKFNNATSSSQLGSHRIQVRKGAQAVVSCVHH